MGLGCMACHGVHAADWEHVLWADETKTDV